MKSSFLKKATAIVCGAATIATLSVAAITASADGTVMVADKTTLAAPTTDAVKYTVKLQGNPGVTNINFTLKYDSRLKPVTEIDEDENKEVLKFETGYAGMASAFVNENAEGLGAIIGCGIVGSSKMTGDNDVLTVWFKLPSDAKAGDKYAISFDDPATEFLNGSKAVEVSSEAGYIEIAQPTTTEATTTTTEETTTTTEETTSATTTSSEVTTSATTASSSEAASGTTSTSASNNGTSASTTTTTAKTTTKAGGNGTTNSGKQDGPTAGDAGVALAIAGLLAAAGTAIVARKKD